MSRIGISEASQRFNISRNTIYKYIKQGKLTRDSDGKLDVSDLIKVFTKSVNTQKEDEHVVVNNDNCEHLKNENKQLKQDMLILEVRFQELKEQLDYVKQNEKWLKQQLDQKLIEHKQSSERKGLLSKLFG